MRAAPPRPEGSTASTWAAPTRTQSGRDSERRRNLPATLPVREYLLNLLPGMADRKRSEAARLTPNRWKQSRR